LQDPEKTLKISLCGTKQQWQALVVRGIISGSAWTPLSSAVVIFKKNDYLQDCLTKAFCIILNIGCYSGKVSKRREVPGNEQFYVGRINLSLKKMLFT
jgi:hypothetical protein